MKLRLAPNKIPPRIRKTTMQELADKGKVVETILFANGQKFIYGLEIVDDSPHLHAHFQDGVLMLHIPPAMAEEWIGSDLVALERDQPLPNNDSLHILIEKDFPCRHKGPNDNADTFQELAK